MITICFKVFLFTRIKEGKVVIKDTESFKNTIKLCYHLLQLSTHTQLKKLKDVVQQRFMDLVAHVKFYISAHLKHSNLGWMKQFRNNNKLSKIDSTKN